MSARRRISFSRSDVMSIVVAATVTILLWLVCWPFAGAAVNDDFSYAFTVKRLVETGRFSYNGWSTAMLGPQAAWGALFVKLFGFSHDVLRVSMLLVSLACATMAYALHRRLGARPRWALLATLTLVASPLFTPWSASFMTDVPGLAMTLAIALAGCGLVAAGSRGATLGWAAAVVALGLLGGSVRQTNFVLAGVALLAGVWQHRRDVPALLAILALLVAHAAATLSLMRWSARQPYAVGDLPFDPRLLGMSLVFLAGLGMTFAVATLPFTFALIGAARFAVAARIIGFAGAAAACALIANGALESGVSTVDQIVGGLASGPWTGNTVTPTGLLDAGADAPGARPIVLGAAARVAMAAAAFWSIGFLAAAAIHWRRTRRPGDEVDACPRVAGMMLLAMAAIYVVMLVPRAGHQLAYDRYLLPLMPLVTAWALHALRRPLELVAPSPFAWAIVAIFASFGAGITRDHFAELRARDRAAAELIASGVPREQIANGLTFDAWTQLEARGHLNEVRITNPADAYVAAPDDGERGRLYFFLPKTPAVRPDWIVAESLAPPPPGRARAVVPFSAVCPPRTRYLVVWPVAASAER